MHLNFVYVSQVLMSIGLIYHPYQNFPIKFINHKRVSVLATLIASFFFLIVYSFGSLVCLYIIYISISLYHLRKGKTRSSLFFPLVDCRSNQRYICFCCYSRSFSPTFKTRVKEIHYENVYDKK